MSTLVGKLAPDFNTSAVLSNGDISNNYNLYDNIKDKYGLLFFYPLDFTFVCPSELISLSNQIEEFKKRKRGGPLTRPRALKHLHWGAYLKRAV